jgi:hypothetical protein
MVDISGYVNLGQVVDSLINEQEISRKHRRRFLQVALEGFSRELNLFHLNSYKGVWLEVSASLGTVDWPSDYVSFLGIGYNIDGQFWSFTEDDNMIIPQGTVSGQDTLNSDRGENAAAERYSIPSYSTPGGLNSDFYKIDIPNRRIITNGESSRTHLLLYYVSSGVNASGNTVVPIQAERALKDYISWRTSKGPERDRNEMQYKRSLKDLRDHEGSFTKEQFLDMFYRTMHQGIKR